jgi:ubiquinone/menaquinone biosynthesis C-methylase UbiE
MDIARETGGGVSEAAAHNEAVPPDRPGCDQTGVLRVLQSRAQTRKFYDKISGVYDRLAEKSEEPVRRAGLEKLAARQGERILEIGYGTGHCLAAIARAVGVTGEVFGLDVSEGMREQARANLTRESLRARVRLTTGDALHLPYGDNRFDGIFMSFTLELFDTPDIPLVLAECRRVLRGGGRIVVVGMSKEGGAGMLLRMFEWTHEHFPNYLDCRPIFVQRALTDAGFAVVDTQILRMWVPVEVVLATV